MATKLAVNTAVLLPIITAGGGLGMELIVDGAALEGGEVARGVEAGEGTAGGEGTHLHMMVCGVVHSVSTIRSLVELPTA